MILKENFNVFSATQPIILHLNIYKANIRQGLFVKEVLQIKRNNLIINQQYPTFIHILKLYSGNDFLVIVENKTVPYILM